MEYAVVKTGGKQYRVSPGDIIEVDRMPGKVDGEIALNEVLLFVSDSDVKIGTPTLSNVKIVGKILAQNRGEKIYVRKFKSKVRYRRTTGFRAELTKIEILPGAPFSKKVEAPKIEKKVEEKQAKPVKTAPKQSVKARPAKKKA